MKSKNAKIIYFFIFLLVLLLFMLWRDLHLGLDDVATNKPARPELTVSEISFERLIGDKLWKVTSPQTYKENQTISATNVEAFITGKNEQTKINAKSGNYNMSNQIFNFEEAKLLSRQNNDEYKMSAKNLSFEEQLKKWNLNGNVWANSEKLTIKTNSAVLFENENICVLPNGGKIIWKDKK